MDRDRGYNAFQSDERWREVLDTKRITDEMPGGFFIYRADESEEIIYANNALIRMFNCENMEEFQELTGNSFRGIVHPDDLEAVEESIRQQIAESQYDLDYVEYRIIQKGGGILWIEDYGHFIRSEAGDVFYVFVGDATEKHRLQEQEKAAMRQEQLRRLELIEGLSIDYESIFYVDFDAHFFQVYGLSSRICDDFESGDRMYESGAYAGFAADFAKKWVYPEDCGLFLHAVSREYIRERLSEKRVYHENYRIVRDGEIEYMQLCIIYVGSGRKGFQVVIANRSIDDAVRHEMEQNRILEEALRQVRTSNMVKDIFLANMSHDIRTPMNAIAGFAALAKMHMDNREKLADYLDKIDTANNQLLCLLNDVLELSRLEAENIHIEETICDLRDIALYVQAVIQPQAEAKGLNATLDLDKLTHWEVYSDREYLIQLLLRLAGNAVKYTEGGGSVAVSIVEKKASHDFATYEFIVEDTGIGVNENFIDHMFEPFERQKNTTVSGVHGTGLGLTIVKNIVEMMEGTIDVSSAAGEGSRFTVTLSFRLGDGCRESAADAQEAEEEPGQLSGRILLVEDNEINQEIEVEILQDFGFDVDTADNGSIGVEMVKNSAPDYYDLILMDIQMPVMDGYDATRAIRALDDPELSEIPIVALSANASEKDRKKSMECGMNDHLAKPIHIPQFLKLVEDMIRRRR